MRTRRRNFGGNEVWEARRYEPASEAEVLEILARHRQERVRAVGSLHSWSDIAVSTDVSLDLGRLDEIRVYERDGMSLARVGAGCTLQALLDRLRATGALTLPTLGVIKRQTVSGAVSTGTHGSGTPGLSHFVVGARLAAYDAAGQPAIFEVSDGDELRALRCSLGCAGILLSLDFATVPSYRVQETLEIQTSVEQVLGRYAEDPLTQFALVPYAWRYLVFRRRPLRAAPPSLLERVTALALRLYQTLWVDIGTHLAVKASVALGPAAVKTTLRLTPKLLLRGVRRVDEAEHVLTMGHHYFRHEEMEFFVPQARLAESLALLRYATEVFAGEPADAAPQVTAALEAQGLLATLRLYRGSYTHHYPFSIRRLLPEDTLLSMGSGIGEPHYSISVFTYAKPGAREPYYAFCAWLARAMHGLFGARLHWGKHFPLGAAEVARAYPALPRFKEICRTLDPHGVFRNGFIARVLGSR